MYSCTVLIKANDSLSQVRTNVLKLFGFDIDWSGENGEDYLIEEAKLNGFKNNNAFVVESFLNGTSLEEVVAFIDLYFEWNSDYYNYAVSTLVLNEHMAEDGYVVTLSAISKKGED